jgi:hypothetical protein
MLRENAIHEVFKEKQREVKRSLKVQVVENEKLQKASQIAISKLDTECDAKVSEAEAEWDEKLKHLEIKQAKERDDLEAELWRKESQRRNIHSSYVRDLQLAERKLAELHLYEDCSMTRSKIEKKEKEELEAMEQAKEKRVANALERLAEKHDAERRFVLTRMRNAMVLARTESTHKKAINQYLFQNKDLQMQHAHAVERNTKVNLEHYARPKWIKLPDRNRQAATSRGSQVFLQQVGDKYQIPSLCDLYGDKSQEELCPPIPSARKRILLY